MSADLKDKVVIVTGADRGIGEAIAQRFAKDGALVAVSARTINEGDHRLLSGSISGTVQSIADAGGRAIAVPADLARKDDRARLVETVERELGPLDVLVNNAAVTYFEPVADFVERHFQLMFDVLVHAPFELAQRVLPGMRARKRGWILNISSGAARHPQGPPYTARAGSTVYGMCKIALERFSSGLAAEVYGDGIAVNALSPSGLVPAPGVVYHGLNRGVSPERLEAPEYMAEAAHALCTGDPSRLTGRITYARPLLDELGITLERTPACLMKITALETVHLAEYPNITFVQVHTDEGLVGVGDTFRAPTTVAAYVHDVAAPLLLGKDPRALEQLWQHLFTNTVHGGAQMRSTEIRGLSAIDTALWDIAAQAAGMPLYRFLGGPTRSSLRVYNTCAGYRYGGDRPVGGTANYVDGRREGPYEDLEAFLNRADELAQDLLAEGYTAMKIWPFDQFGPPTNGQRIDLSEVERGCEPFDKIRRAVGNRMEIALEMHSVWGLVPAQRIAQAVEPFAPMWFEDPVRMDNLDTLLQFRQSTRVPTTASETLSTRWAFREALEKRAVSIVMLDVGWVGGISEARKIAAMAEVYGLAIAPHDCVGPITLMASLHLDYAVANVYIQEVVRAYLQGVYPNLVTFVPAVEHGAIRPPDDPGLGTRLLPDLKDRPDAVVRFTRAT